MSGSQQLPFSSEQKREAKAGSEQKTQGNQPFSPFSNFMMETQNEVERIVMEESRHNSFSALSSLPASSIGATPSVSLSSSSSSTTTTQPPAQELKTFSSSGGQTAKDSEHEAAFDIDEIEGQYDRFLQLHAKNAIPVDEYRAGLNTLLECLGWLLPDEHTRLMTTLINKKIAALSHPIERNLFPEHESSPAPKEEKEGKGRINKPAGNSSPLVVSGFSSHEGELHRAQKEIEQTILSCSNEAEIDNAYTKLLSKYAPATPEELFPRLLAVLERNVATRKKTLEDLAVARSMPAYHDEAGDDDEDFRKAIALSKQSDAKNDESINFVTPVAKREGNLDLSTSPISSSSSTLFSSSSVSSTTSTDNSMQPKEKAAERGQSLIDLFPPISSSSSSQTQGAMPR